VYFIVTPTNLYSPSLLYFSFSLSVCLFTIPFPLEEVKDFIGPLLPIVLHHNIKNHRFVDVQNSHVILKIASSPTIVPR
jgi:hypothetical protein